MSLTMNDDCHKRVTDAANLIGRACQEIEQAGYHDPTCRKLHLAACALHKRFFRVWERNVKERRRAHA